MQLRLSLGLGSGLGTTLNHIMHLGLRHSFSVGPFILIARPSMAPRVWSRLVHRDEGFGGFVTNATLHYIFGELVEPGLNGAKLLRAM